MRKHASTQMTKYVAEIRNIVSEILKPIADVKREDHRMSSTIRATIRETRQTISQEVVHGMGYSSNAWNWASSILIIHDSPGH